MSTRPKALFAALEHAETADAWREVACALDVSLGLDAWRADDRSAYYDARSLKADIVSMEALAASHSPRALARALHATVHHHLPDLRHPALFHTAWGGTKHLVSRWLDAVCAAIDHLAADPLDPTRAATRLAAFQRESRALGRSALLLSGGASLGFIHLGVTRALFEQGLLPRVLTGASMGAMVASGIGSRTDEELTDLFWNLDQVRLRGLALAGPRATFGGRGLLDPDILLDTIRHNCGHDLTFAEAEARTGRALVISVAPTRRGQSARVLDPVSSPDVLIAEAAQASASLPGMFPPAQLMQRAPSGEVQPYLARERWVDGSLGSDLPKQWLARLHGVSHFVVSQANPHVLPFLAEPRRSVVRAALGVAGKAVLDQAGLGLEAVRRATAETPVAPWTAFAHAMAAQDYTGDISIHPAMQARWLTRLFTNPSRAELAEYVRAGEHATWPHLARIDAETRIQRHLESTVARLLAA